MHEGLGQKQWGVISDAAEIVLQDMITECERALLSGNIQSQLQLPFDGVCIVTTI
jgi:hypothetical protein